MSEQKNPLLPGYSFNAHLVAGVTEIEKGNYLDFCIDRPKGMDGFIINLTKKGKGIIYGEQDQFICSEGDFILFPPNTRHYYGREPNTEQWHHYWIYFRANAGFHDWLDWPHKLDNIRYSFFPEHLQTNFVQLFKEIVSTVQSSNVYSEMLAMNLLEQFLLRRMQQIELVSPVIDERVLVACHYIVDHLGDNQQLTLNNIADYVCLSASHFSHLFHKTMNMTLSEWKEEQLIKKARILLENNEISIADIAAYLGYSDQFYFSKVFKKKTGLCPQKFRKKNN